MPSETDAMGSVSKEEEDTEKSNEPSVALITLNSMTQESNVPAKHINIHLTNANGDKVSTSNVRTKFLNLSEDAASTTSSVTTNDLLETENSYLQDENTGNVSIVFLNIFNFHILSKLLR